MNKLIYMPLFIANWKMQLSVKESVKLAEEIKKGVKSVLSAVVILCPSFDALESVAKVLRDSKINLGAQDMFWEGRGQFTGEESALNLKELGCKYVIIGHSERRKLGETDEDVRKKMVAALKMGLVPIVCVGETLEERRMGKTFKVLEKQLAIFSGVRPLKDVKRLGLLGRPSLDTNLKKGRAYIIIAYEPVWAIGAGVYPDPRDVGRARDFIFKFLEKHFPPPHPSPSKRGRVREGERITIIYGGSVDSKNISKFLKVGKMEGALIGGASLKANEFIKIVKSNCQ